MKNSDHIQSFLAREGFPFHVIPGVHVITGFRFEFVEVSTLKHIGHGPNLTDSAEQESANLMRITFLSDGDHFVLGRFIELNHYSHTRVERYLSPESAKTVTIQPFCIRLANWTQPDI